MGAKVVVEEDAGGWTLRFDEPLVTRLCVDYRFSLLLEGGVVIAIGEPFDLRDESGTTRVPPGDAVYEVARALPLFNQRVESVRSARSGELSIRFEGGAVIDVPVNEHYENWEIVLPWGEMWVGLPGGGVSHFEA
ncbi:MAG: hypothetical protein AVDCRST_MAG76-2178 [uncultured Acidimicrobiales bacterium]|uniref:Uncharacterized protein n=1 Tax=uncultured Acidimicrobiales bacterium TaxID=310071 RepID=A0A6J4IF34_9ACTN|nr:MAG: hypothetical protein AVDCRST_MAG76-2178 [uncultured Acidimicrobiales bacterium]